MDATAYGLGVAFSSPLVLAGLLLFFGGLFGLVWMLRDWFGYDEPEIPPVIQPATPGIRTWEQPAPTYWPAVKRFVAATDEYADIAGAVAREAAADYAAAVDETAHLTVELRHRIADKLRQPEHIEFHYGGPVCPICGGAFHPVCPSAPKSASEDDCPLTTQEIPPLLDAPVHDRMAKDSNQHTQELSGLIEKARTA